MRKKSFPILPRKMYKLHRAVWIFTRLTFFKKYLKRGAQSRLKESETRRSPFWSADDATIGSALLTEPREFRDSSLFFRSACLEMGTMTTLFLPRVVSMVLVENYICFIIYVLFWFFIIEFYKRYLVSWRCLSDAAFKRFWVNLQA